MKQEIIKLGDLKVTIKELRIKDVRMAIANIKEIFDENVDMEAFINEKYDIILDIAKNFIDVEGEYELDDLTFSDIDTLTPAFKRVNKSFLDKLVLAGILPEKPVKTTKKASTKQSPH